MDTFISEDEEVAYGVPQGSILGPTLFLLYINDLSSMKIPNAKVFSYADDTSIVFTGNSWHDVKQEAEMGMAKVADWLNANLLTLNTSKTNYVCFSVSNRTQPMDDLNIKIHMCGDPKNKNCACLGISRISQTKYLGVVVDQRLSWYQHLDLVTKRVRRLGWIFKSLRHIAPKNIINKQNTPRNILNEVYLALAQSVLLYCITVWGGATKTKLIELERAQRALIKIMYYKNMLYPTNTLYIISDLLSIRKLYIIQAVLKKHKALPYVAENIAKRRKDLVAPVPQTKTMFTSRQFNKRSAQLYNKINKQLFLYKKNTYDCRKTLTNWIKKLTYEETEALLMHIE